MAFDEAAARAARRRTLTEELQRMQPRLRRPGVRRVVLVGSLARGDVGPFSDLDLVIVQETEKRFLDRTADWLEHLQPRCGVDLFVYTPEEFEEQRRRPFLAHALEHGRVLVEA